MLSLESVLAMARPRWLRASAVLQQKAGRPKDVTAVESGDLGVSFVNIGREAGLNAKTIFGGGTYCKDGWWSTGNG